MCREKFLKFNQFRLIQSSKFSPYEYVKIMLHNQYCINEMLIPNGVMDHYSQWCHGPLFPMVSWTIIPNGVMDHYSQWCHGPLSTCSMYRVLRRHCKRWSCHLLPQVVIHFQARVVSCTSIDVVLRQLMVRQLHVIIPYVIHINFAEFQGELHAGIL